MKARGLSPTRSRQVGGLKQTERRQLAGQKNDGRTETPSRTAPMDLGPAPVGEHPLNAGRKEVELHQTNQPRPAPEPLSIQSGRSRRGAQPRKASN